MFSLTSILTSLINIPLELNWPFCSQFGRVLRKCVSSRVISSLIRRTKTALQQFCFQTHFPKSLWCFQMHVTHPWWNKTRKNYDIPFFNSASNEVPINQTTWGVLTNSPADWLRMEISWKRSPATKWEKNKRKRNASKSSALWKRGNLFFATYMFSWELF